MIGVFTAPPGGHDAAMILRRILVLLLAAAGTACAAPSAMVLLKKDVLECIVDDAAAVKDGEVVWLFGEGAPGKDLAGLSCKLEGGRFSVRDGEGWREPAAPAVLDKNGWRVTSLPASAVKDAPPSWWRMSIFPAKGKAPVQVPASGAAPVVRLDNLDCLPITPTSMDIECFLVPLGGEVAALRPWPATVATTRPEAAPSFHDPFGRTLWWPCHEDDLREACRRDAVQGRLAEGKDAIVFDVLRGLNAADRAAVQEARRLAAAQSGRLAVFYLEKEEDLLPGMEAVILRTTGVAAELQRLTARLGTKPPARPWVSLDASFFRLPAQDRELLSLAWTQIQVRPLLRPDVLPEELEPADLLAFLWLRRHVEEAAATKWRPKATLPPPAGLPAEVLGLRLTSSASYLCAAEAFCRRAFAEERARPARTRP